MRRMSVTWVLLGLLVLSGCGKKGPEDGPYGLMAARMPAVCDVVVFVDLAEVGRSWESWQADVLKLPVVAENPGVKQLVEEQQSMLRMAIGMAKGQFGLDPMKDLTRLAIGLTLTADQDPGLVLVVEGKFPLDLVQKFAPGITSRKLAGQDVYTLPGDGAEATILGGKTLIMADPAYMQAALEAKKLAPALAKAHPGLFAEFEKGFLFRASVRKPAWLDKQLEAQMAMPGISTLLGTQQLILGLGDKFSIGILATDAEAAKNLRHFLEAEAEILTGGQHLIRGLAYGAMVLDLDALPDVPAQIAPALANRKALDATIEQLLPEPQAVPPVVLEGSRVSLEADRKVLKGAMVMIGVMAAVAIPAFMEYQQKAAALRP